MNGLISKKHTLRGKSELADVLMCERAMQEGEPFYKANNGKLGPILQNEN